LAYNLTLDKLKESILNKKNKSYNINCFSLKFAPEKLIHVK
jgi:hypothetical protein